jgi:hypothetical protein
MQSLARRRPVSNMMERRGEETGRKMALRVYLLTWLSGARVVKKEERTSV